MASGGAKRSEAVAVGRAGVMEGEGDRVRGAETKRGSETGGFCGGRGIGGVDGGVGKCSAAPRCAQYYV